MSGFIVLFHFYFGYFMKFIKIITTTDGIKMYMILFNLIKMTLSPRSLNLNIINQSYKIDIVFVLHTIKRSPTIKRFSFKVRIWK